MKKHKITLGLLLLLPVVFLSTACGDADYEEDTVVLRVSNWEEYIDEGDWDDDELIDLEDGTDIIGYESMVDDFEEWYADTYGVDVKVEYSTFGTNEELYNQLTIGDVFDLVCPSEYMIMKMMREGMLVPFSEDFYNTENEYSYYANGVSPYIKDIYDDLNINGEAISKYAAGYMWGTLGLVYNPEEVTEEEASRWDLLINDKFRKRVTVKDSVRDTYIAALPIIYYDEITSEEFVNSPDFNDRISEVLNRTDAETVAKVEELLTEVKEHVYSFETDSGKADMVTGKVVANLQWSGDAVYTMDQADEDEVELCYSVPNEGSNIWFDGWVMLKDGVNEDPRKQQAAEAFINFVSRPDNAIRNMYYIGYTSVISGGDSDLILEYIDWNFGAEEDEEETFDYDISYFFGAEDGDEDYTIVAPIDQYKRQLMAQYPSKAEMERSAVMRCFEEEDNKRINRMWTNIRCFDLKSLFD